MLTCIVMISNSQVSRLQSPQFCVIQDLVAVAVKKDSSVLRLGCLERGLVTTCLLNLWVVENENREKHTKEPHPFLQLIKHNSLEYYMLFISLPGPVLNCISIPFLNKLFHGMNVWKFLLNFILWFFPSVYSYNYFEIWLWKHKCESWPVFQWSGRGRRCLTAQIMAFSTEI